MIIPSLTGTKLESGYIYMGMKCYIVFGFVLARPSQNKLIWFSDAVLLFAVEWRQNEEYTEANEEVKLKKKKTDKKNYI